MTEATEGCTVKVHYTGSLADGTVFDSSRERDPLEVTLGEGGLIAGFEEAVLGMKVGENQTVDIPAAEAYGDRNPDLVYSIPVDRLPEGAEIGSQLSASTDGGGVISLTVIDLDDDSAMLDANHPLAGRDLTFEIELMDIVS